MKPLILPIRTVSIMNLRENWRVRAKRAKTERKIAFILMPKVALPCTIKLTRIAPRELDDDNLRGSQKSVRDGIADRLGIDDRDRRVRWDYGQEKGGAKEYAVRVEVE